MATGGGFSDPAVVGSAVEEMLGAGESAPEELPLGEVPGAEVAEEPAAGWAPPEGLAPEGEEEEHEDEIPEGHVQLPDGTSISLDRLRELATMDQAFRENPTVATAVRDAVQRNGMLAPPPAPPVAPDIPGYTPAYQQPAYQQPIYQQPAQQAAAPQGPQIPPDVEVDDPTVRWVLAQQAENQRQFQALQSQQAQILDATNQQMARASADALPRARDEIAKRYPHLTFDDIAKVEATAGERGLGTHFLQQYGDPYRAAFEAMETAAIGMPDLRSKILAAPPSGSVTPINKGTDGKRKQKLTSLAGTGGTAPRTEPTPVKLTDEQKRQGMADEIARAMTADN
jgi:hypothetical protein